MDTRNGCTPSPLSFIINRSGQGRRFPRHFRQRRPGICISGDWVPPRTMPVQYLEQKNDSYDDDMLGICYLLGYGCPQDVARGRMLLEKSRETMYRNYGLGMMYAEGLSVPEDIAKGVAYLKAAGNYKPHRRL